MRCGGGECGVDEGAANGGSGEPAVEEAVADADEAAASAEGLPGCADARAEVVAVFGEDAGCTGRAEGCVECEVGLLGEGEELVLVAQAGVDGEGGFEAPVVLKEAGPLLRVEDGGLLAEALGEGAEAEVVDGRDDGGAAAVGVGVDAEGVVGDPVDEASGVACGGVAVVVEGTLSVGEGIDVVVDEADVDAGLDLMAAVGSR